MKLPSFPIFSGQKNIPDDEFIPFPDLPQKPSKKKIKTEYIIFSISLFILLGTLSVYLTSKNGLSDSSLSSTDSLQQTQVTPTHTPKPLPNGKQVYNFSHGNLVVGPKPTQAIIDPIDPEVGNTQIFTIKVPHDKPITIATTTLVTDNNQREFTLENISSDIWQAEWKVEDTYNYKYQIQFEFSDANEAFTGALTFR